MKPLNRSTDADNFWWFLDVYAYQNMGTSFAKQALIENLPCNSFTIMMDKPAKECSQIIKSWFPEGFKFFDLYVQNTSNLDVRNIEVIFQSPTQKGGFVINIYGPKTATVSIYILGDPSIIVPHYREYNKPKITKEVHVFCSDGQDMSLMSIGEVTTQFKAQNYPSHIVEAYKNIQRNFFISQSAGRLLVLDGPPGTGKTNLVEALIAEALIKDTLTVFLPPHLLTDVSKPEFIGTLLNYIPRDAKKCVTLIVEDADMALLPRKAQDDKSGSLSALLNLSDGMVGKLLNIHIIATTNLQLEKMDEAIMRNGRLFSRVSFPLLTWREAQKIIEVETGLCEDDFMRNDWTFIPTDQGPEFKISLADTYGIVRKIQAMND